MHYICCVRGCNSTRGDAILHKIPVTNEKRLYKWLQHIDHIRSFTLEKLKKLLVCQKHFEKRFITDRSRLHGNAYPSLFTADEISDGVPSVTYDAGEVAEIEHSYSRKRHYDHSYSKLKSTLPLPENINIEDNISLQSDDSELNNEDEAIVYFTQVDENDFDEDNLVYLNKIQSIQPTNEDSYIPYLQEVTNNVPNKDGNIGSLPEVVIENGNIVYLPEVDGTAAIENKNLVYLLEDDANDPDEDSHIPYLQEVTKNVPNKDCNIGYLPEGDGAVIEDGNFFYLPETDHDKVTKEGILGNKDFDISHVSNMCRTCLCIMDDNCVHLENEVLLEQPTKLTEMLVSLGCVMDFGDDNWSKYICMECTKSLVSAYKFKMKCLSSTQTLLHELTTIRSQHMEKNNTTGNNNEEYQLVLEQTVVQDFDCNESYELEKMDVDKENDMDDNCIINEEYPISVEVRESIRCIKKDCDKKFAKVKSLIHHLAQYHPDERRSFCEKCSIGCTSEKRLIECFIERLKSPSDSSLKENRPSKSEKGTFPKCKGCGKRFTFNTPKSRNSLQPS